MRRPVVGLSLFFAGGVWVGLRYGGADGLALQWLAAAVFAWALAIVTLMLHRDRLAALLVYGLAGLMGMTVSGIRGAPDDGKFCDIPGLATERTVCTVEGIVCQDIMDATDGGKDECVQFGLRCDTIRVDGFRHAVSPLLYVTLYGTPKYPPVYGERWVMNGTLSRSMGRGGRVGSWRFRTRLSASRRQEQAGRSLPAFAQWVRREAAVILAKGIELQQDEIGVVNALLLGYRARLPPDIQQSFVNTGTMHIFAISGIHVAILCSVLICGISLFRVPRTGWVFALAPAILLYAMTTGSRASAIRAGLMASAYLLAPALRRRPDAVSALALAGILILAWKPEQLLDIGFIFSFAAVAGILTIVPVLEALLHRGFRPDPLAVPEFIVASPWWHRPALQLGQLMSVSLAAWLTSVPLSLYFFERFTPVALIANLLVIPLSFLIIVTGCLALVGGACVGLWLAAVFNAANVVFVRALTLGMRALENVPYGHVEQWSISGHGIILWYVLLAVAMLYLREWSRPSPVAIAASDWDRQHPSLDLG